MKKCSNSDHPHCTVWVMPGETACAHGHPQPADAAAAAGALAPTPAVPPAIAPSVAERPLRPHLHVSGFDPRAAGGRQAIRLDLRGMPPEAGPELTMLVQSHLSLHGGERHAFTRTRGGDWRPVVVEFSSRGLEHGQYRIDLELHSRPSSAARRAWACTLLILAPRPDATLGEIHQTFLSTHKNVRVTADDGSIARVAARTGGDRIDIDVSARDASIAQLELDAQPGKIDLGLPTIAWDEDLVEIDLPVRAAHPFPAQSACLIGATAISPRHMRLFAGAEFVLGRFDTVAPEADLLLAHFAGGAMDADGLTRRLSARHAVIRRGRDGFEIEDVSRYGLLLDGAWPGKNVPVPLRAGMRIGLTASIRGVVSLVVQALLPHAVLLQREDEGALEECFWLMDAEHRPATLPAAPLQAAGLPCLYHRDGGFWLADGGGGKGTPLTPTATRLPGLAPGARFEGGPYPEGWTVRAGDGDRRRPGASVLPAPVH